MPYLGDPQGREKQLQGLRASGTVGQSPQNEAEFIQMLLAGIEGGQVDPSVAAGRLGNYRETMPLPIGMRGLGLGGFAAQDHANRMALRTAMAERAGMRVNMEQAEPNEPLPSTLFDYGQSSAVTGKRTHPTNPTPPQSAWYGSQASSYRQPWEDDEGEAPRRSAARTASLRSATQAALTGLGSAFNSPLRRT